MDIIQKPSDSECYTRSSEPFRLYLCLFQNINEFKLCFIVKTGDLCWGGNASPLTGERWAHSGISLSFQYDCKRGVTKFMARNNSGRGNLYEAPEIITRISYLYVT
jgi:hypothetical protein